VGVRKILVFNRITIDGMFAGPDGDIDWFVPDPEIDQEVFGKQQIGAPDTVLFGKTTYEMFESYWPKVAQGAANLEYSPEGEEALIAEREIAELLTRMTKIVVSHEPRTFTWENSTAFEGELIDEVKKLKTGEGGDIIIFGSGTIVQQLQDANLIDDYWFILTPVVLGRGKPQFKDVKQFNAELVSSKAFNSGNILLHYTV
jgi:dihydrofolate reductase